MAYFLKQAKRKGRIYLSIVESFYHPDKKETAHKTYKSLSSVDSWIEKGIENPIAHFQKIVDELNEAKAEDKVKKISKETPEIRLGYFPIKGILEKLNAQKYVNFFKMVTDFKFDLYELLAALVYARVVHPCSKNRTFHDVLPSLGIPYDFSYDQLLDGISFFGENYAKFVEIFTVQTKAKYGINTDTTYFDGTNFYFEIDREDDFRRKGPSKEKRTDPIVGLGLLLDRNQLPISMQMYPGNASEKPVLRDLINKLKHQNIIVGRTIHVADKGINCANNIAFTRKNGDGYIFSKAVKNIEETERTWMLLDNDYTNIYDSNGKLLYKFKSCIDKYPYTIEYEGKEVKIYLKEKRMAVYNSSLAEKQRYEIKKLAEKAVNLVVSKAKKSEYGEAAKYIEIVSSDGSKPKVSVYDKKINQDLAIAGYNLFVTSELNMPDQEIYNIYHNLWRIEESFKIMKSDLDARPVFLQKENSIKGHFLICYIAVLLERILQFKVLKNEYSASEIFEFFREFRLVKSDIKYINMSRDTTFINALAQKFNLHLTNYYLSEQQLKGIMNYKL